MSTHRSRLPGLSLLPKGAARWLERNRGALESAWDACDDGDWLMWIALAVEVDRRRVVHAAAELAAELAVRFPQKSPDVRPRRAIVTALCWARGETSDAEAWASGSAAMQIVASEDQRAEADVIRSAAYVGFACDARAAAEYYLHQGYAAKVCEHAVRHFDDPRAVATMVRRRVPADLVAARLAAAEAAAISTASVPDADGLRYTNDSFLW